VQPQFVSFFMATSLAEISPPFPGYSPGPPGASC